MPLPELRQWETTSSALHQAVLLYSPIHSALRDFQQNYLHLPTHVEPTGLTSGAYPQGGMLRLNFVERKMSYTRPSGEVISFTLADHTQSSLFEALLRTMKADELAEYLADVERDSLAEGLINKLNADENKRGTLKLDEFSGTALLEADAQGAAAYAEVQYTVFTAMARFRARLTGHLSPIVVWPEHFDLSTLWFAESDMDEHKAHLNFGFAPFSPGLPQPYLYIYAYPYPDEYTPPSLPEGATWESEVYTGIYVSYDQIAKQEEPAHYVEALCTEVFPKLVGLLLD